MRALAEPRKALIQLSVRGLCDDRLWFDLFHECGHVLKHRLREVYVDGLAVDTGQEEEADSFACDLLIARPAWQAFTARKEFRAVAVREFAAQSQVTPGIVVGRLQHEGLIPF